MQGAHENSLQQVALEARPARTVVFVPDGGEYGWIALYRFGIRVLTAVWGGFNDLLLPMPSPDQLDDPLLWQLLEVFDADCYHVLAPSFLNLRDLIPGAVRARIEQQIAAQAGKGPAHQVEPGVIESTLEHYPIVTRKVPDGLTQRLAERLGDLRVEAPSVYITPLGTEIRGLLTAAENLGPRPSSLHTFGEMPTPELGLLAAAATGDLDADVLGRLTGHGLVLDHHIPKIEDEAWKLALNGVAGETFASGVSNIGLLPWVERAHPLDSPPVLVVGSTPWDFALAWSLRALGIRCWWVPESAIDSLAAHSAYAMVLQFAHQLAEPLVRVCSTSSETASDSFITALRELDAALQIEIASPAELIPSSPVRLYSRQHAWNYRTLPVRDGVTPPLDTPLPPDVEVSRNEISWVTDVNVESWLPIRSPRLAQKLVEYGSVGIPARCGRSGLSYQSLSQLRYMNAPLHTQTARPSVRTVDLFEQVTLLLDDRKWSVAVSDKGAYLRESAALFGGLRELESVLSGPAADVLSLYGLEDKKLQPAGGFSIGNSIYFPMDALAKAVLDPDKSTQTIFGLLNARALTRGIAIQCGHCRQERVYRIDEIDETFRCERCGATQPITTSTLNLDAIHPDPTWMYGLNEVLRQFLCNHGDIPFLGAWDAARARGCFDPEICGELEFSAADEGSFETDIVMRIGTELWVGEGTAKDNLEKSKSHVTETQRLQHLQHLADTVGASGVLLASSDKWRQKTRNLAQQIFSSGWPTLDMPEEARCVSRTYNHHAAGRGAKAADEG